MRYGTADATNAVPETFVPGPIEASDALNALLGSSNANFADPSRSDHKLMPSINAQYKLGRNATAYASYTRGFKAGGYSGGSAGGDFGPETVDAYEIGLKGNAFDRRLSFSLSAFLSDYTDLQESLAELLPSGSVRINVANAASARSRGFEMGLSLKLADWLRASTEFTYLDATYRDYSSAPCSSIQSVLGAAAGCVDSRQDLSGKRRSFAPEYSGNFSLDAEIPVGEFVLGINPSVYYTSWFYQSATADDLIRQKGYAKFDLRVGFGPADKNWELAVLGKNLTDRTTAGFRQTISGGLGSAAALADRPVTVAVQFSIRR